MPPKPIVTLPPLKSSTVDQIINAQLNISDNLQILLNRQSNIIANNTDDYYYTPPTPLATQQRTTENFENTNEGSIMLNPENYPEVSDYADIYNQNIALLDDPRNMINASFNTYLNIQDRKMNNLRKQLIQLEADIQNNKLDAIQIKGFKSMHNSQILNVEPYNDPKYKPRPTNTPNTTTPRITNDTDDTYFSRDEYNITANTDTNTNTDATPNTNRFRRSNRIPKRFPNSTKPKTQNMQINGAVEYPNYLIYGNNGCLQYEPSINTNTLDDYGNTKIIPATWAFKPCDANETKQQFVSTQVNNLPTYNKFITSRDNIISRKQSKQNIIFGFNVVNPINSQDQCLQLNNDGLSVMPCNLDFDQRFRPIHNTVIP